MRDWKTTAIGSRLRSERVERRLSVTDASIHAGASPSAWYGWERGIGMPAERLTRLAERGWDVMYLITGAHVVMTRMTNQPSGTYPNLKRLLDDIDREQSMVAHYVLSALRAPGLKDYYIERALEQAKVMAVADARYQQAFKG